jgi:anti-sigma factor RsiW
MITCRELVEVLLDFVSDELAAEQRAQVTRHLDDCPLCSAYLESYRIVLELPRRLRPTPLPPRLAGRLQALLEGNQSPRGADTSPT